MEKIVPFVRNLEKFSRSELKKRLSFGWPNNRYDEWWENPTVDNPHRYWFVDIDWLYNKSMSEGLYFRIDTLEWDSYKSRYVPCQPTLKINWMKIRLKLKNIGDPLRENARLYKKVLRDRKIYDSRSHYESETEHPRTRLDPETWKYVSEKPAIKIRGKVRARKDSSKVPKNEK